MLVASAAGLGLFTGLLANGGGFLLMPLYLLVFGLRMRQAVGTSLLVIAVLSIPTLVTHWALGHIDWTVAFAFTVGTRAGQLRRRALVDVSALAACSAEPSVSSSSRSARCSPSIAWRREWVWADRHSFERK